MRSLLFALVALAAAALLSSSVMAQNCTRSGKIVVCDNGVSGVPSGNTIFWNNGTSSTTGSGIPSFNSDGASSTRPGNNDGAPVQSGNTTYFSDGRSCIRTGDSIFCN